MFYGSINCCSGLVYVWICYCLVFFSDLGVGVSCTAAEVLFCFVVLGGLHVCC